MKARIAGRLVAVAAIVGMVVAFRSLPVGEWLLVTENWLRANPGRGLFVYVALSIVALIALVPGWVPMMLGGLLFGVWPGLLYAMLGIVGGATAAQLVGRTLARDWVAQRVAAHPRLAAIDEALDRQAFAVVTLSRLAFVVPFNVLNYAYGLTRVRLVTYVSGTALGMLPIVAMYAYLGSLAQDMRQVLDGDAELGVDARWFAGIAVAAIVAVVLIVKRAVGRALDARMRESTGT